MQAVSWMISTDLQKQALLSRFPLGHKKFGLDLGIDLRLGIRFELAQCQFLPLMKVRLPKEAEDGDLQSLLHEDSAVTTQELPEASGSPSFDC
ncbi:hypothetical protein M514_24034 [Trichuris suis]|uniref:Uncharacterized protein n=1 Tax=Trichuris suis TaxID=68888 RepID=A0A085N2T0_9BILA|nr:hypothetical protein M514_24034 [Trichuris suis]